MSLLGILGAIILAAAGYSAYEWITIHRLKLPRYVTSKTCFLVSDKSWKDVLGLIPVAIQSRPLFCCLRWPFVYRFTRRQPVLVFHEEDGAIDADSVIYFLQQYSPDRLYLVGDTPAELNALLIAAAPLGAGLAENSIFHIQPGQYPEFWLNPSGAVLVDSSNYKAALMAAVFASLKSVPLFFVNVKTPWPEDYLLDLITFKTVYAIDEIPKSVSLSINAHVKKRINYSTAQLITEYVRLTKTNKIILVNPNDLTPAVSGNYQPDKSADPITALFSKDSLTAPILAAGRREVILFPANETPQHTDYDELVEKFVNEKMNNAKYLTIIGSPSAISQSVSADPPTVWGHRLELDGRFYGSVVEDLHYVDLATGRIYGITPSDTSANIARSLFYSSLPRNRNALVLPREDHQPGITDGTAETDLENYYRANYWTPAIEGEFTTTHFFSGHDEILNNQAVIQDSYDESHLVFFADHGGSQSFSGVINSTHFITNQVYLMCPVVIDLACSTGEYDVCSDTTKQNLFVVQSIRRGAIVQMSAVSVSYWHQMFDELLINAYTNRKSLGEAFRIAKNAEYDRDPGNFSSSYQGDPWYFLMGDPVFVPKYW